MQTLNPESIYYEMKEKFSSGTSNDDILDYAIVRGIPQEEAKKKLTNIQMEYLGNWEKARKAQINTSLIVGSILLAIGITFSFIIHTGFIFYGAIIAGIVLIYHSSE